MLMICLINSSIPNLGVITLDFLKKEIKSNGTHNQWITKGIRISHKRKKELFILCRYSNDLNLKIYYKRYCSVLSKVILTAKNCIITRLFLIPRIK